MSLWTPSGEHSVGDDRRTQPRAGTFAGQGGGPDSGAGGGPGASPGSGPGRADEVAGRSEEEVEALRRQLADAPPDVVVANHCYGLFELAAVYLSDSPPKLEQARTAIDALGFLVDGLGERLGEAFPSLRDALAQLRLAFVQLSAATTGQGPGPDGEGAPAG